MPHTRPGWGYGYHNPTVGSPAPDDVYVCAFPAGQQAKNIVIATGGQAKRIPIPGAEHAIISDQVNAPQLTHAMELCNGNKRCE